MVERFAEGFEDLTHVRVGVVEELWTSRLLDDDHPDHAAERGVRGEERLHRLHDLDAVDRTRHVSPAE
ncbi:MAG: hypothetical protein AABP62_16210 [Planctomycetota bacterium]